MKPIAIIASGMVTNVGLNSASSCAAIRSGIDNFSETRFKDKGGELIVAAQVPLEGQLRGATKLAHMAAAAIKECLAQSGKVRPEQIPLLLCVAEKERPSRWEGLDNQLLQDVQARLEIRFHPRSSVIGKGRVSGAIALDTARNLVYEDRIPMCIIAGVDSFLDAGTLAAYEEKRRLHTSQNSNGFIPGEAAAAILVGPPGASASTELLCMGIGTGREKATIDSEEPLRADGLVQAFKAAFADAQCGYENLDYRLTDANGEQYLFKEAALAMTRTLRIRKELFDIWHPADCIGEIGAATAPCALAVALAAARKNYAPGRGVLCHFSSDNGERVAVILGSNARRNN